MYKLDTKKSYLHSAYVTSVLGKGKSRGIAAGDVVIKYLNSSQLVDVDVDGMGDRAGTPLPLRLGTEFHSNKIPRNRFGTFRYSAEESAYSEAFRAPWKSSFRALRKN
jgi:hypothetical protein